MKHTHYTDIPLEEVAIDGARKTKMRWLVSQKDGAPNFAMRLFEVEPGGFTPYHSHSWEHENFILEGKGALVTEDGDIPFKPGDVIYVEPHMKHNYKNTGDKVLKFLCIITLEKLRKVEKKTVNPFATGTANNC
ncbi:MAG: cupin domain-containing protein [Candidatus Cloacimonetes bacterium]|nr:cupin domain-containing protein [Candidatus Cloacimonadota bacterium]